MHSKNTINKTKSKKPKKHKTKIENVGGLQPIYLLDAQGMSSKLFCVTFATLKNLSFPRKTSRWKCLEVELARFIVMIAAHMENDRSSAAKVGKGGVVLYQCIHPTLSIH